MIKRNILDCMTLVGGTPLRFEGEKTYVSTGAVDCDHVDYAQTERVTYDNRPSRANLSVAEGDILFAKMCGTKKTLRIDRPLSEHLYSTGFCAVRANESLMDAALLYHLLASDQFLTQKDQNSSGATQKAITNAGLRKIVIQVPDLPEQRKLAANLDCIEQMMANRREQLVSFDQLVKSRFIELFGEPELNPRDLPVLPWGAVFQTTTGKLDSNAMVENGRYPFFTCAKESYKIDSYAFDCEALLLAGNNAAGIYDVKHYKGKFNAYQRTYVLRLMNEKWSYILFKRQLEDKLRYLQSQSKGTNTRYLTLGILNELRFVVPPIAEQEQFATFVEQTDKSKLFDEMEVAA